MENNYIYETVKTLTGEVIKRPDVDGVETWIPTDPANSDYIAFLEQQKTDLGK